MLDAPQVVREPTTPMKKYHPPDNVIGDSSKGVTI